MIIINNMMISLLRIIALSEKRDDILEILQSVIDQTWGLPGCLDCAYYEEKKREGAVLYVEQWETKDDLNRHIKSDLYQRIISVMELAVETPEISFHEVSRSMGIELVETLRTDIRPHDSLQSVELG